MSLYLFLISIKHNSTLNAQLFFISMCNKSHNVGFHLLFGWTCTHLQYWTVAFWESLCNYVKLWNVLVYCTFVDETHTGAHTAYVPVAMRSPSPRQYYCCQGKLKELAWAIPRTPERATAKKTNFNVLRLFSSLYSRTNLIGNNWVCDEILFCRTSRKSWMRSQPRGRRKEGMRKRLLQKRRPFSMVMRPPPIETFEWPPVKWLPASFLNFKFYDWSLHSISFEILEGPLVLDLNMIVSCNLPLQMTFT